MNVNVTDGIVIDRRFRGPSDSGNGGYVAGRIAALLAPHTAEVRLHRPPPLATALTPRVGAGGLSEGLDLLTDDGTRIATARPVPPVAIDVPVAPTVDEANRARKRVGPYPVQSFRGCFVCGPDRAPGDGMHLHAGARDGAGVAVPWTPDASLARDGVIGAEFVWAALDCPGYFACRDDGAPMVLGQIAATIHALPTPGGRYVVSGWSLGHSGRKHQAGTAVHAADGTLLALAQSTWIELPPTS